MYKDISDLEDLELELETLINIKKAIFHTFQTFDERIEFYNCMNLCKKLEIELLKSIKNISS